MVSLKSKYLVVFGPSKPIFNIEEDFGLSPKDAAIWSNYLHSHLKHHMFQFGKKYVYFVKPNATNIDERFVVDDEKGSFYSEFLSKYVPSVRGPFNLIVRRVELIDGEFYCTEPYTRLAQEVRSLWAEKGLSALDP